LFLAALVELLLEDDVFFEELLESLLTVDLD